MPRIAFAPDARSPWIIVPLTAADLPGLEWQVAELATAAHARGAATPVDAVEWRVDLYEQFTAGDGSDPAPAVAALARLAELLPDTPVLATLRTRAEGGASEPAPEHYVGLIRALAASGLADAVDVEFRHLRAAEAMAAAHDHGTPVVASSHDFAATPAEQSIVARLEAMEHAGADVAKIAVTPTCAADVVTLIAATERRHRDAGIPLVTMSMGSLGAITRIGGGVFGSAATFATVGPASAPGQLPAAGVRAALDLLGGESPAPDGSAQP